MTKEEKYVEKWLYSAEKAGRLFKLDPLIILAQGAHESGWGTSNLALNHNNFFGITTGGAKSNAFWEGKVYVGQNKYKLKFRSYSSAENGFKDFARLISSKYTTAYNNGMDYKKYADSISKSAYISEKNGDNREGYKRAIISHYEKISQIVKKKEIAKTQDLV